MFKSGKISQSEFRELFNIYYPRLILFAGKFLNNTHDIEDCVLESFNSLWEKGQKLESKEHAKSYLYTSVRNKCLNKLRANKVRQSVNIDEFYDITDDKCVELSVIDSELHAMLHEAINRLPEDARKVIELNVFEKLKMYEIAEDLNITINQVKALKTKAMRKLKKNLGNKSLIISILFDLL